MQCSCWADPSWSLIPSNLKVVHLTTYEDRWCCSLVVWSRHAEQNISFFASSFKPPTQEPCHFLLLFHIYLICFPFFHRVASFAGGRLLLKPNHSSDMSWNEIHWSRDGNSWSWKWGYWPKYGSKPNKRWKWQMIAVYSCPILMHRSGPHGCALAKYEHASRACENGVGVKPNGCYHAVWQTSSSQSPRNAMDGTQVPIIAQTSGNGKLFQQSLNLLQKQVHASLDTHKHTHTNLNCTSSSDSSPALLVMSTLAFLHTTLLNLRPTPCNT